MDVKEEEEAEAEGKKTKESSTTPNQEVKVPEQKEVSLRISTNSLLQNSPSVPKDSDTVVSSPASSVILVTKADVAKSGNEEEEEVTQHEPRGILDRHGYRFLESNDSEDEVVQLTAECLEEEASQMKKELGESDSDKSETVSLFR